MTRDQINQAFPDKVQFSEGDQGTKAEIQLGFGVYLIYMEQQKFTFIEIGNRRTVATEVKSIEDLIQLAKLISGEDI